MASSKVTDVDRGWREAEARIALGGLAVKLGIIGANASRVHAPEQQLTKSLERYLQSEDEKGNVDATLQLQAIRASDAEKRIKHIFKPGPTMAELGEIFEFGLGNNPERSWLRGYKNENETKLLQKIKRVAEAVFQGKMSAAAGMNLLGLSAVGGVKRRIQAGIQPPLAASTLRKKGPNKTTPLINTAAWIGSISHEVVPASEAQQGGGI